MRLEILSSINLIIYLLIKANIGLSVCILQNLHNVLTELLHKKYINHWNPENPKKGSGYRCIRINNTMDPLIKKAAKLTAIPLSLIKRSLPLQLTIWIDPKTVDYRIGENGSIGNLFTYYHGIREWLPEDEIYMTPKLHPRGDDFKPVLNFSSSIKN
jgi:protein Tob/BTG